MKKLILFTILTTVAVSSAYGAADRIIFNGGITLEERAVAPNQGTRLVFAVTAGNFLANIAVTVTSAGGDEIVNTTATGPWLILDLDPGQYQVRAMRGNGQVQSLSIEVGDSSQVFTISFTEEA